jgi:hypothetical protein
MRVVSRPKLSRTNKKHIALMGILYFIFETIFELVMRYSQIYENVTQQAKVLLALPVALLNSILYWWTFITVHLLWPTIIMTVIDDG